MGFSLSGPATAVSLAEKAIKELAEKGYTSLSFEDFSENAIMVPNGCLADIIGKEGKVVRKIKEALKVEVNIPKDSRSPNPAKKVKVGIAGSAENVARAKEVLTNIITNYCDPLTHPDETFGEIDVPEWQ